MKLAAALAVSLLLPASAQVGAAAKTSPSAYLKAMKRGGFGSAITTGTSLTHLCRIDTFDLVYYDNRPPDTGHANGGIVVFHRGKYSHNYSDGQPEQCQCKGKNLICRDPADPVIYTVPLSAILKGREILIGGELATAWRGSKPLHAAAAK